MKKDSLALGIIGGALVLAASLSAMFTADTSWFGFPALATGILCAIAAAAAAAGCILAKTKPKASGALMMIGGALALMSVSLLGLTASVLLLVAGRLSLGSGKAPADTRKSWVITSISMASIIIVYIMVWFFQDFLLHNLFQPYSSDIYIISIIVIFLPFIVGLLSAFTIIYADKKIKAWREKNPPEQSTSSPPPLP